VAGDEHAASGRDLAEQCRASKQEFLGLGLHGFTKRAFVDTLARAVENHTRLTVSYLNPYYAVEASRNPKLRGYMQRFDVFQADGWGIVYGARLAGIRVPERVAIEDFERPFFSSLERAGASIFLFGAEPGMAERTAATLLRDYPHLLIAGCLHGWWDALAGHSGWFDSEDNDRIIETINGSGADVLLVSLPTPLQQTWVLDNAEKLRPSILMTVGAYFDHLAEGLDWYPKTLDRFHLDFLYRIYRDPGRLWRRYLFGAIAYGRLVMDEIRARRFRR
jgi:N-acetylglucosaminyldiphosphoundecaprenol N-acetyl-beta-D-mannosaminyltransferase